MEKFNGEIINLFGEELLLHERSIKDAFDQNEFAEDQKEWTANSEIYFQVIVLLSALKYNIELADQKLSEKERELFALESSPFSFFAWKKARKITAEISTLREKLYDYQSKISIQNVYQSLGIGTLRTLVDKVRYDLEKQPRTNEKGEKVGRANMTQLVAKYSFMKWDDVEKLSVSEFSIRLEQAINMMNMEFTGKFGIKSQSDEQKEWEKFYEHSFGNN